MDWGICLDKSARIENAFSGGYRRRTSKLFKLPVRSSVPTVHNLVIVPGNTKVYVFHLLSNFCTVYGFALICLIN